MISGSMVVERCPVDLKRRLSVWGEPAADFGIVNYDATSQTAV